MEVINIDGYRDSDKSTYIEIEFSKDIKDGFDGSSYIKVIPNIQIKTSKVGNKFIVRGNFILENEYAVTVLK